MANKERYKTQTTCNDFKHHYCWKMNDSLKEWRTDMAEIRVELTKARGELRILNWRMINVEKTLETFATKEDMRVMLRDVVQAFQAANRESRQNFRKDIYQATGLMTVVLGALMGFIHYFY